MDPELREYGEGGLSEADVDRTVAILRRLQIVARIVVFLVAVGAGGLIGAVIAYRTGADMSGGVVHV